MRSVEIPVITGDGVGPELMTETRGIFSALQDMTGTELVFVDAPMGENCYKRTGVAMPDESLELLKKHKATLAAPIAVKQCPPPSPMGRIRRELNFYSDVRFSVPQAEDRRAADIVFYRECSEDFLPDRNMFRGSGEFMPTPDVALSLRVTTREKCARIAREAFEFARNNGRKKVTVAHKSTVFCMNCGMFWEEAQRAAADYPGILCEGDTPDNIAGTLVTDPSNFDVILAANLFGDILADVGAAKAGNLMSVTNSNGINSMFYPSHNAMPDYKGTGKVNPLPMFYSAVNMLKWVGLKDDAVLLEDALIKAAEKMRIPSLILPDGVRAGDITAKVAALLRHI
jgi:3-isopropylmalate dehydrogenase